MWSTNRKQRGAPGGDVLVLGDGRRVGVAVFGAGIAFDAGNLWRPWGFPFTQITVPAQLWHGDADNLALVAFGRLIAAAIPGCQATFYPGEGHAEPLTRHADEIMAAMAG